MTNQLTRREWHRLVLGGLGASALASTALGAGKKIDSRFQGVLIGAQSYSFRDRPLDKALEAYVAVPLGEAELWQGHVEPRPDVARLQQKSAAERAQSREKIRKWRPPAPPTRPPPGRDEKHPPRIPAHREDRLPPSPSKKKHTHSPRTATHSSAILP